MVSSNSRLKVLFIGEKSRFYFVVNKDSGNLSIVRFREFINQFFMKNVYWKLWNFYYYIFLKIEKY